jgi:hypothetical protein
VAPAPVAPPKPVARPKAPILSPAELLLKADDIRAPGKNFVMEMTITSKKGKKEKVNKTITRIREAVKSLVVYTYPPTQKGQAWNEKSNKNISNATIVRTGFKC